METKNLDILFVIVLYNTKLKNSLTYLSILESLSGTEYKLNLLVYNNSAVDFKPDTGSESPINVTYIWDVTNGGVSKAYNAGAGLAKKLNKRWILLLDQDTRFPGQTINQYLTAIEKYPKNKLFAPIILVKEKKVTSPCYFKFMRGFSVKNINIGINSLEKYSIINCGMCIDVDAFYKNGGYNELLKLDFSDHDFIRRFKKNVDKTFVVINLEIDHQLSSESKNSFKSDFVRFEYYLQGAKNISSTLSEKYFLKLNAAIRSVKLSLIHRNFIFSIKFLKWL